MNEKELVESIKNSFLSGMKEEEIKPFLGKQNFPKEYTEKIIKEAKPRKKIFKKIIIIFAILFSFALISLSLALFSPYIFENPEIPVPEKPVQNITNSVEYQITAEDISYIISIVAGNKLKASTIPRENPIINIKIENENYFCEIDKNKGFITTQGSHQSPDIETSGTKKVIHDALISESVKDSFIKSFKNGEISLKTIASETELLQKGYLNLYKELNN